jgi:hypothetical protein
MGVRFPSVFSTTFIGPLPANATETAILTTPPLSPSLDGAAIFLLWFAAMTAGTSVTAHVFRIRRGTTTGGALVGANPWTDTLAATNLKNSSGWYVDLPGAVGGQQYTLTVVQTAATVAGTFQDGALLAFML